jgi:hypothetical protein
MIVGANSRRQTVARLPIIALLGLAYVLPAHATLGGTEATVITDQAQIKSTLRTVYSEKYAMHELVVPSGSRVREYVAPSGVVFGIAWQGPTMPDLRQLLGPYFSQYADAVAARRGVRGPVTIQLPGLVVQSGGRMRAFSGKAYSPESLPQGVSPDDVQ